MATAPRDHSAQAPVKKKCVNNCEHEFQDKRYGKGIRLLNPIVSTGSPMYRCTVCGTKQG